MTTYQAEVEIVKKLNYFVLCDAEDVDEAMERFADMDWDEIIDIEEIDEGECLGVIRCRKAYDDEA